MLPPTRCARACLRKRWAGLLVCSRPSYTILRFWRDLRPANTIATPSTRTRGCDTSTWGRDATTGYGYVDLRFRNPHPHPVRVSVAADELGAVGRGACPRPALVLGRDRRHHLTMPSARDGVASRIAVHTTRRLAARETEVIDDLGTSCYVVAPAVL